MKVARVQVLQELEYGTVFLHVFFVHSEVTGVSCIKYIGDCFASTPSVLIGVRDFFCMFCVL